MAGNTNQLRKISGKDLSRTSLKEIAHLYHTQSISWIEFAPALSRADDKGIDLTKLVVPMARIRQILTAYRLLQAQRPNYLSSDLTDKKLPVPSTLCYVLTIYRWSANKANKEELLNDLLDGILEGRYKETQIRLIAKKVKAEKGKGKSKKSPEDREHGGLTITSLEKSRGDPTSVAAFESALKTFDYILDTVLERNSYVQLRPIVGKQCRDLSNRLNCIADEEFHKLWKQRREGVPL